MSCCNTTNERPSTHDLTRRINAEDKRLLNCRAVDMFLKVRHVQSVNGDGGVIFATGTPIANSMAEMFTMQRYLQPDELTKHHLHHFDS